MIHGSNLVELLHTRKRLNHQLTAWSRSERPWKTRDNLERSAKRGAWLLAELVALHYAIAEQEARIKESLNGADAERLQASGDSVGDAPGLQREVGS